jgi:hypothetical protein
MRGAAWRISSPFTTLTAAGVSSSDTVCGVALTIMVCSSALIAVRRKITGTSSRESLTGRNDFHE